MIRHAHKFLRHREIARQNFRDRPPNAASDLMLFRADHAAGFFDRAVILTVLAACIFIPVAAVLMILDVISVYFICLYDRGLRESLFASWDLIVKKWPTLLVFAALLWLTLSFAFAALVFVVFLIVLVFSGSLVWIFSALILVPSLAILSAFHQTAWLLAFLELIKPVKFEETEEIASVPEIAGG